MGKTKFRITKLSLKRAVRTFLQTAIGYVVTNVTFQLNGIDFADGNVLKNALIGLAVSAFSAGASAVMNLEIREEEFYE